MKKYFDWSCILAVTLGISLGAVLHFPPIALLWTVLTAIMSFFIGSAVPAAPMVVAFILIWMALTAFLVWAFCRIAKNSPPVA